MLGASLKTNQPSPSAAEFTVIPLCPTPVPTTKLSAAALKFPGLLVPIPTVPSDANLIFSSFPKKYPKLCKFVPIALKFETAPDDDWK